MLIPMRGDLLDTSSHHRYIIFLKLSFMETVLKFSLMCWISVCGQYMRALLVSSSNIERLNIGKWIPSYQPPIRAETPPTSKSSRAFAIYCGILCKCKRTFKGPAYEKETTLKNYQKKMFVGLLLQKSCPSPIIRCLWKEFSNHFGIR